MNGPFETDREVTQTPQVQAVYAAFDAAPGVGRMAPHNLVMLTAACDGAGVVLGAYDRRILAWLAGWEPQTCAAVAGLITRARQAVGVTLDAIQLDRVLEGLADAATYRRHRAAQACADCDQAPDDVCGDHLDDLDLADTYGGLAELLRLEATS